MQAERLDFVKDHARIGLARDVFGVNARGRFEHGQIRTDIGQPTIRTRTDHVGVTGDQRHAGVHVDAGLCYFFVGQFGVVAQHHVFGGFTLRFHTNRFEHAAHTFRTDQPRLRDTVRLQPS